MAQAAELLGQEHVVVEVIVLVVELAAEQGQARVLRWSSSVWRLVLVTSGGRKAGCRFSYRKGRALDCLPLLSTLLATVSNVSSLE